MAPTRDELRAIVMKETIENSTMAVFFHAAIADRLGIGPTDDKTLLLLQTKGPLTAGEIAQLTGLTTASVTNLIDRLEHKGFVQRVRDTADRRRVIVQPVEAKLAALVDTFTPIQVSFDKVIDSFSDEQLATIAEFLNRATTYSRNLMDDFVVRREQQSV